MSPAGMKPLERHDIDAALKPVVDIFAPVFFVYVGAQVDVRWLNPAVAENRSALLFGLGLTLVGFLGKFAAGFCAWGRVRRAFIGAGMVPRGELGAFYERAAVVALPSLREGFGMVCLEAMAHGRPVVASATGGLLDLVEDGTTGLLVPPGDVPALRAAIERLLADEELRRRLGAAARERVRRRFTRDQAAARLTEAYADAARLAVS